MAVGFRQWLAALTIRGMRHQEVSYTRSASLPERFRHVAAGLNDSVNALRGWTQEPVLAQASSCTTWISAGKDHLGNLLSGLTDLVKLHHPHPEPPQLLQDPERRMMASSSWSKQLLSDLILLADAHNCYCELLVSLKQLLVEAQAAVRHQDAARLGNLLRSRSDRGLSRLASTLRALSQRSNSAAPTTSHSGEAALANAVAEATSAAAAGSASIFAGLAAATTSSALRAMTSPTAASPAEAMQRLQSLEDWVVAAEDECEQVHRSLVNTMDSLLSNAHSHS